MIAAFTADAIIDELLTTPHWNPYHYPEVYKDYGRKREYQSEWDFGTEFKEESLMSNQQMAEFLATVASDQWFLDRFGDIEFRLSFNGRRRRSAACNYRKDRGFTLKFPGNGSMNNRLTALHELTHIICHKQSHGPVFCSVLLQIVGHVLGWVAGDLLRSKYIINGVRFVR